MAGGGAGGAARPPFGGAADTGRATTRQRSRGRMRFIRSRDRARICAYDANGISLPERRSALRRHRSAGLVWSTEKNVREDVIMGSTLTACLAAGLRRIAVAALVAA